MANSTKISEYSTTAANNTSIDSIDIDENCAASGINNALRSVLKHQADAFTQGTPIALDQTNNRVGIGTTSPDAPLEIETSGADFATLKLNAPGNSTAAGYLLRAHDGDFDIRDANNSATRMTIDSDGKLLIGTTSSISDDLLQIQTPASGGGTGIQFKRNDANTDQGLGRLRWGNTADDDVGIISVKTDGATDSGAMLFQTASSGTTSERMRIDSNGHVGINDTNPSEAQLSVVTQQNESAAFIHCNASSMTGTTLAVSSSRNTTNGTYRHLECAIHGVAVKLKVMDSGQVQNANGSYTSISDERMKENIADASSQWDDIKAIRVRNFNMIGDDLTQLGVIAQELEAAGMSGLVGEGEWYDVAANPNNETRKYVKQSILYMKAVKALQEAMDRIETLENEMTALKARVTALEA